MNYIAFRTTLDVLAGNSYFEGMLLGLETIYEKLFWKRCPKNDCHVHVI